MNKLMLGIFFTISLASSAHAEVIERKLSVPGICGEVLISFLLGYAAARFKTIFILSAVVVGGLLLIVVGTEMNVSITGRPIIKDGVIFLVSYVSGFALQKSIRAKSDR